MTNKEAIIWLREIKEKFTENCTIDTLVPISRCDIQAIDLAIKALEEKPQGKWIIHDRECLKYGCNQCGNLTNINSNFCPNCGADMRGNKNETTFDDYLKEQLKDPEFRKEWEKLCDEEVAENWWWSYFKRYGWKWNIIWEHAAKDGFVRIGNEEESDGNT